MTAVVAGAVDVVVVVGDDDEAGEPKGWNDCLEINRLNFSKYVIMYSALITSQDKVALTGNTLRPF